MKPPHLVTFLPTFLQILHIAFYLHWQSITRFSEK
jgi:hypothetical protein